MTGKRKPRRAETRAAWIVRANKMRAWLTESREKVANDNRLAAKARLLVGDDGGGHGVTVAMRQISEEAAARPVETLHSHATANRETRRHDPRYGRTRHTRTWMPPVEAGGTGRYVWPTPPGQNQPYVKRSEHAGGGHA